MNASNTKIKISLFKSSMMFLCLTFLVLTMAVRNTTAQVTYNGVPESDSLALVAFYNSMSGDAWFDKGGWLVDPVIDWVGVGVANAGTDTEPDFRVVTISYRANMGESGVIPPEIGDLDHLEILNLQEGLVTGEVPLEIGKLERLDRFRTSRNFMFGEFPFEELTKANLRRLEIDENYYVGDVPDVLGGFDRLQRFDIRFNRFAGVIPPSIADMPSLQRLRTGHTNIGGDFPDLSQLSSLQRIEADNMPLDPGPVWPWLQDIATQIRHLFIMNSNRTGEVPEWIDEMVALTDAGFGEDMPGIEGGGLGGTLPASFEFLDNLTVLVLQGIYWEGEIPSFLGEMTNLDRIYLRQCSFSGDIPGTMANLTNRFEVRNCPYLTGGIPDEFEVSEITHLIIDNSPTNTNIYIYWPFLPESNQYVGGSNMEVGELPNWIGNLTLGDLVLANAGVTGTIPPTIQGNTNLVALDLSYNPGLTGEIPDWLGTMTNLSRIDFSYTGMTVPSIPEWIHQNEEIRAGIWQLGLAGLDIEQEIPMWIGDLPSLMILGLADNKFHGSVPASLGNLRNLDSLNLANNNLSGELPANFYNTGRLATEFFGIESIDLSGNPGLTGELSMDLVYATEMRVFHFDGTNLTAPNDPAFQAWMDEVIPANSAMRFPPIYTSVRKNIPTSVEDHLDIPARVHLYHNYPNPFNPTTTIKYDLPMEMQVTLTVYNVLGQKVATLVNGLQSEGSHEISFNAAGLASGTYLYRLEAGDRVFNQSMMLIK